MYSGYRFASYRGSAASCLEGSAITEWWKSICKFKLPTKIKIFMWKAFQQWLPVMSVLEGRGMPLSVICPVCKDNMDTIVHALWGCISLLLALRSCRFMGDMPFSNSMCFMDFALSCLHQLSHLEFMELVIVW
ncbi:hypothetical protein ACOSQ3_010742 [Xanthoceras sorbifolium]